MRVDDLSSWQCYGSEIAEVANPSDNASLETEPSTLNLWQEYSSILAIVPDKAQSFIQPLPEGQGE
jgi:hypothetical protein